MNTDPIADLLVRIKNGYMASKLEVSVPYSKTKEAIVKVMDEFEFVGGYAIEGEGVEKVVTVGLRYDENTAEPAMENFKRVSKPSVRSYVKADDIKDVMNGYGIAIISTSEGVMAGHKAKEKNLGGELIAEIW